MPEAATPLADPGLQSESDERRMHEDAVLDNQPAAFSVTVFDSVDAAESIWRTLESEAVTTPYQRFDWIKALLEARGQGQKQIAIAVIERDRVPVALLPIELSRRFGLSLGRLVGSDIANIGWMPVIAEVAPQFDRVTLDRVLREVAEKVGGVDALSLRAMPRDWQGVANPLLTYAHQPGPDHLYLAPIGAGAEPRANAKRMRNIMRGKRRLEEMMGPVTLRAATTPGEIAAFHKVFLEQRSARFAEQGIANVFAEDWCVRFFEAAAQQALGSSRPAMKLHALFAGEEIVATSCGTCAGHHYSQYINSMTTGPAAKSSLMALLMLELIEDLTSSSMTSLDMGLGDFDYKTDWTDRTVVYEAVIPLTVQGRLAAAALSGTRWLRRAIKQNERVFGALKWLRKALGGRGAG